MNKNNNNNNNNHNKGVYNSPLRHLSDKGLKKSIPLILPKTQLIKISKKPVSQFYQVLENLGEGTYGKVKKVKHKQLGEIRAMKIVNKKLSSSM